MQTSDIVAIISLMISVIVAIISVGAFVSAKSSARAASRQNEISLNHKRLKIYQGISNYGLKLIVHGLSVTEADIWTFDDWVQLSEFYFCKKVFNRLDPLPKKSLEMLMLGLIQDQNDGSQSGSQSTLEHNSEQKKILHEIRDEIQAIRDIMKETLRVDGG